MIIRDILSNPSFEQWRETAIRDGYQSFLALPLSYDERTIGTVVIYSKLADAFNTNEVNVLLELANDLALGIKALRLRIERLHAEEKLIESEERYHSIVTAMAEGVVFQDAKGLITEVNDAAKKIEGRLEFEIIGRNINDPQWDAIHEDGTPFPAKDHPALVTLRSGEPQSNVVMGILKPDGSRVWISINTQPLFRPKRKKPYAVVTTFHDITERKEADEALKESALKWDTTFHSIKDYIFLLDTEGVILQTNKKSFELFGKEEEGITGHHCYEIVHNSSDFLEKCPLLKMKKSLRRESAVYEINDGWFEATVDPILDENKNLFGAVHTISDINERKFAEDELKKQVSEINRFKKLMMGGEAKMNELKREI
ncbi:MAG: PAS domain S-box protein, partial [Ignavibacteria bacterium]|nr:PAS domain S-box protein [Ignavibacteria bacterium]